MKLIDLHNKRRLNQYRNVAVVSEPQAGYLLDTYTNAKSGISFRKLKNTAVNCCQIRRSSDNALATVLLEDIGQISLSSTIDLGGTLGTWIGSDNGFIEIMYDQSGSGNDFINNGDVNIINSGVLITNTNGDIAFEYSGGVVSLYIAGANLSGTSTIFDVFETSDDIYVKYYGEGGGGTFSSTAYDNHASTVLDSNSGTCTYYKNGYSFNGTTRGELHDEISVGVPILNSTYMGTSDSWVNFHLGGYVDGNFALQCKCSELILFDSDETANQVAIEEEINSFYGTYLSGSDTDARRFIDAVLTLTTAEEVAINNLVVGLKANGTWSKYKAIYPFIGGTASSHKWNLKDPFDLDVSFRLSFGSTTLHDSTGIKGDNTVDGVTETHFVPATELLLNDAHISFYSNSSGTTVRADMGAAVAGYTQGLFIELKYTDGNFYNSANSNYSSGVATNDVGHFVVSRISSTEFLNGVNGLVSTISNTSTSMTTNSIWIHGLKAIGGEYSNRYCSFATIGDGLTSGEVLKDSVLIQEYQEALGRAVSIGTELYTWSDAGSKTNDAPSVDVGANDNDKWRARLNSLEACGAGQTDTTEGVNGGYCIKLSGGGGNKYSHLYATTVIGKKYRFIFWAKSGIGTDQRYGGITLMNNDGEWHKYIFELTADATVESILFYTSRTDVNPATLYIDEVSIIELD